MATPKQIAANRRNAKKSTGPSTPQGKAIASANALRHGLLASQNLALPWEDAAAWDELHSNLLTTLRPEGAMELGLAEQIAGALWRLRRAPQLEAGVLAHNYFEVIRQRAEKKAGEFASAEWRRLSDAPPRMTTADLAARSPHGKEARQAEQFQNETSPTIGHAVIRDAVGADALGKLRRYETALENTLYRAHHELMRLQAARSGQAVALPAALDIAIASSPAPECGALEGTETRNREPEFSIDVQSTTESGG